MFLRHEANTRNAALGECALIWHANPQIMVAFFFAILSKHKAVLGTLALMRHITPNVLMACIPAMLTTHTLLY